MSQRQIIAIVSTVTIAIIAILLVAVGWWTVNQKVENKNLTSNISNVNTKTVDLESFKTMARKASCADRRNDLYVIDDKMVFWVKAGNCADASYGYKLYGENPQSVFCTKADSIAGPMMNCNNTSYQSIFQTIINNLDKSDFGLGTSHTVQKISLNTNTNTDTNTNSKRCDKDSDCGLLVCGGCFSNEYLKTAPPDLACRIYEDYKCLCINNKCTEVKKAIDLTNIKTEAECVALGAEWVYIGKMKKCEYSAADAGRSCTKATDCELICELSNVNDTTGTCSRHSGSGCYNYIDSEGKPKGICVD